MNEKLKELFSIEPDYTQIPGGVKLPYEKLIEAGKARFKPITTIKGPHNSFQYIQNALSYNSCMNLIEYFEEQGNYAPVSIQGFNDNNNFNGQIGSNRITGFNGEIANDIFDQVKELIYTAAVNEMSSTDWWQGFRNEGEDKKMMMYDPVGFSPMLRFMKYQDGGQHYAHYDAGFIYPEKEYRTLKSFVLYLTTNSSGDTRFIKDNQSHLPIWERNHSDWSREANESEVIMKFSPIQGNMLIFDHRLCHDVNKYYGKEGDRIIIRGDVLFKAWE